MSDQVPGAFRTDNMFGINVFDQNNGTAGWTAGATIIDNVGINPEPNQRWSLQQISFQAYLNISTYGGTACGRLGRIIAGVGLPQQQQAQTVSAGPAPWATNCLPLPQDPSLTATLWDPEINPLPPITPLISASSPFANQNLPIGGAFLPVEAIIQMTNRFPLVPGQQLSIGIWMLPSLLLLNPVPYTPQFSFGVFRSTYALTYARG